MIDEFDSHMKPLAGHVSTHDTYDSLYEALQAFLVRSDGLPNISVTDTHGKIVDLEELMYDFNMAQEIC
jgi:hypothetical protein